KALIVDQHIVQSHPIPAGTSSTDTKEPKFAWSKTDHTFLDKHTLFRFHRTLGDVLLEKGYITTEPLMEYLEQDLPEKSLGAYLRDRNIISEAQLMEALAEVKRVRFIREDSLEFYDLKKFRKKF